MDRRPWYRSRWALAAALIAALGFGGALAAPEFAAARGGGGPFFGGPFGFGGGPAGDPQHMREHAEHMVQHMLDQVNASDAQRQSITAIATRLADDLVPLLTEQQETRQAWRTELGRSQVDRAALEKLRSEMVAQFDQMSRRVVTAVADASAELTPEQRAQLIERMQNGPQHRGGRRGHHGGWRHGQRQQQPETPKEGAL